MSRRSAREAGFTIIEVVVAVFVLMLAALATFGLLTTATKGTQRAKGVQIAHDLAQKEMEALRSLPDAKLAMTEAATYTNNPLHPSYRVSNAWYALRREPPGEYQRMVVNGSPLYGGGTVAGGVVNPGPVWFKSGDVSGAIFRYIVWRNDYSCPEEICPGTQDYKQIVVAVKVSRMNNEANQRGYVEVQSDFIDPTDNAARDPAPNEEGKVVSAEQFFLTDTPCSASPLTQRQEITGDHALHNTLGTCASGLHTGKEFGAPDVLVLGRPPDPTPEDPTTPLYYDYSNDWYLTTNPDTAKGLQISTDNTKGCNYQPTGEEHPESQIHRWVTDPLESPFTLTGNVTLEFYTRTLNDASYKADMCIYVFEREERGNPPEAKDWLLSQTQWSNGNAKWPRNEWAKVRVPLGFTNLPYTIQEGHRLGVALSLERKLTEPAEAVSVLYDHPNFPTRLEVDTTTPLEGG